MNIQTHFLLPFFLGLILYKLGFVSVGLAVVCGLVGMLIDMDHVIEHMLHQKKNRFSLRAAWNNSIRFHRFNQRSLIHSWPGLLILSGVFLLVVWWNWRWSWILAIGYYSHLVLDFGDFRERKFLRWEIEGVYLKESYKEIVLNLFLLMGIVLLLLV